MTDKDMKYLADKTIKIGTLRNTHIGAEVKETYYIDTIEKRYYPEKIYHYEFLNAKEFGQLLEKMWEYQGKEDMKELIPNCVASTYKYYGKQMKEKKRVAISPFIYEF